MLNTNCTNMNTLIAFRSRFIDRRRFLFPNNKKHKVRGTMFICNEICLTKITENETNYSNFCNATGVKSSKC